MMRAFLSVKEARGGGFQNDPLGDTGLWMLQFSSQLNKQYIIWKLKSSATIWGLSEVTEAHSLAQEVKMKKILGEVSKIVSF